MALVAASSLVIGALISLTEWVRGRRLRLLIGFGAGALVSAVAYDLFAEAVRVSATGVSVAAGFVVGALVFYIGDEIIDRLPGGGSSAPGPLWRWRVPPRQPSATASWPGSRGRTWPS